MLIDGNSLTYRAFFALPTDMATASGQVTNAVFGFTSMLINLLRDHPHDGLAVAFDRPEPTFRHERVDDLQGQPQRGARHPAPADGPGPPGDRHPRDPHPRAGRGRGRRHHRHPRHPGPRRGPARHHRHRRPRQPTSWSRTPPSRSSTTAAACRTTRSTTRPASRSAPASTRRATSQYAALRGDPSDNLPGVPGVGEKTAAKLINKYGGLDGIFEHLDEQTPKLRQNLERARGAGPRERRGDGAPARRRARRRDRRPRDGRLRRRGGPQPLRLPRVPHALRPAGRGARDRPRALRGQRGGGARGGGHLGHRAVRGGGAARAAGERQRPARGRGRLRGRALLVRRPLGSGRGHRRRRRRGRVAAGRGARRRQGARRARPRCSARTGGRSPPTTPSRCSPGCCAPAGPRRGSASTPRSPPTSSIRPTPATSSRACC